MKKTSLLLLLCCIFQSTFLAQTTELLPDLVVSPSPICNLTTGSFVNNRIETIIHFTAYSSFVNLTVGSTDPNVAITGVVLYKNNLTGYDSLAYYPENNTMDSLLLDSLEVNGNYILKLIRSTALADGNYEICLSGIEKILLGGTIEYLDASGNLIQTCAFQELDWTLDNLPLVVDFFPPELNSQSFGCNVINVCMNQTTTVRFRNASGELLNIEAAQLLGPSGSTITYNADYTEAYILFSTFGDYRMITAPYNGVANDPSTIFGFPWYNPYTTSSSVGLPTIPHYKGWCAYYAHWNVLKFAPPAIFSDNILCVNQYLEITAEVGASFSNLYIDGVNANVTYNSTAYSISSISGVGQHTIEYDSYLGNCPPIHYSTTVDVVNDGVTVSVSNCGLATFQFNNCQPDEIGSFTINFGDGTFATVNYTSNPQYITHQYASGLGVLNWTVDYVSTLLPPTNTFTQVIETFTGTIQPIYPLPLLVSNQGAYLCELSTPIISILSTTGFTNIVWTATVNGAVSPLYPIIGQGTSSINISTWPTYDNVILTITATTPDGCSYAGVSSLVGCCPSTASNAEYFESTYFNYATDLAPQLVQLNAGLPNVTTSNFTFPEVISLPTAPALTAQINTAYATPTTFQEFITANPSYWNSATQTLSITDKWVYFNNDFIINSPSGSFPYTITILNSPFIRISANRKIQIENNVNLIIKNSTLAPKCNQMWSGLKISSATASIILRSSNVIGAEQGLTCANDALVTVMSSKFIDNYMGLRVSNYANGPLVTVSETYFGDKTGIKLKAPYNLTNQPYAGIYIENSYGVSIGNTIGNPNLFHNNSFGIIGRESNISVKKNTFLNILLDVPIAFDFLGSAAIDVKGGKSAFSNLVVGGTPNTGNIFMNCHYGVSSNTNTNLSVQNNYFRNIDFRCVTAIDNQSKTIKVRKNYFNSLNKRSYGVYVKDYANNGFCDVSLNNFNNTNNNSSLANTGNNVNTRMGRAIYLASTLESGSQNTKVDTNVINNFTVGIHLINLANNFVRGNTLKIHYDNATISALGASFGMTGVLLQKAGNTYTHKNNISRTTTVGLSTLTVAQLQGIKVENSIFSNIWKNNLNRVPAGIYAYGANQFSKIECNEFDQTVNGLYLNTTDIGNQGRPFGTLGYLNGYSAGNQWSNLTFGDRASGIAVTGFTPPKYYHRVGVNYTSLPNTGSVITDVLIIGSPANSCGPTSPYPMIIAPNSSPTPQLRAEALGALVNGSLSYDSLDFNLKHYYHGAAFKALQQNTLLNLGSADDVNYIAYQNAHLAGSATMRVAQTENALLNGNAIEALAANANLDANCSIFGYNKMVNAILIQNMLDTTLISSADSIVLYDIACLDPLLNGSAVYQARAILDWDGSCYNGNRSMMENFNTEDEISNSVTSLVSFNVELFPNPNEGTFNLIGNETITELRIFDLSGKEVVFEKSNVIKEITTNLSAGLYVLQVTSEQGNKKTMRLEIK